MMKDSRGKQSKTLTMVWACLLALLGKFIAGIWFDVPMTAGEFGMAATGIIGVWVAREWKDKDVSK